VHGTEVGGHPVLGADDVLRARDATKVELVNGLGSVRQPRHRAEVFARLKAQGFSFASVVHPSAVISRHAQLGEGVQVMAGAVIQCGCHIGRDTIINTRASIDHDCRLGDHVHIAPGVTLSGGVQVGDLSHLGTGASVIQGIRIGTGVAVGAGAVVIRDVPDGSTVFGVPARRLPRQPPDR
jgi:UDP-perosamine 4-acetyltransferase